MKVRLGDICEILNGFAFKSENYVSDGIRIIRIANVQKGYIEDSLPCFYPLEQKNNLSKYMLYEGDLLLSLTGNVGRVALLNKNMLPAALNQRVACLRLKKNDVLMRYLFHFMNSDKFEQDCVASSKGIAQKNMSTEWLKEYTLCIPTMEIQQKVIGVLDKIDTLIEKRNQQLEKLDLLVKSQFIDMFGDPVANQKGWEIVKLSDVAYLKIGPFGSLLHKEDYVVGGHALVNPSHIEEGKINVDVSLTLSDAKYEELSAYHLLLDDIVLGRRGEMGRCAVVKEAGLFCGTGCMIVRPNGVILSYFLQSVLSSPSMKRIIEERAVGVTMANLNVSIVSNLPIPRFPIEKQKDYSKLLEQTDKSKSTIKRSLEKLETLKKALMQKYFK